MTIDPAVLTAIMAFLGIGVIGIIQAIKGLLKLSGVPALILSAIVSVAATYFTLKGAGSFNWLAFVLYSIVVFGEATGLYDIWRDPVAKT